MIRAIAVALRRAALVLGAAPRVCGASGAVAVAALGHVAVARGRVAERACLELLVARTSDGAAVARFGDIASADGLTALGAAQPRTAAVELATGARTRVAFFVAVEHAVAARLAAIDAHVGRGVRARVERARVRAGIDRLAGVAPAIDEADDAIAPAFTSAQRARVDAGSVGTTPRPQTREQHDSPGPELPHALHLRALPSKSAPGFTLSGGAVKDVDHSRANAKGRQSRPLRSRSP
jgi:hypothetical protein